MADQKPKIIAEIKQTHGAYEYNIVHPLPMPSGKELLEGIKAYALDEFGPMAYTVFSEWGVHGSQDFGEIVFNLVESGRLGKTENDSREDFKNGYLFEEAFLKPFEPQQPEAPASPASRSSRRRKRG